MTGGPLAEYICDFASSVTEGSGGPYKIHNVDTHHLSIEVYEIGC